MAQMQIKEFEKSDIPTAAYLFCKQYEKEHLLCPDLPDTYENVEAVIPLITQLSKKSQGIAMKEGDELTGYLMNMVIPGFKSPHKGVYCPEWAHGATQSNRTEIYRRMYEAISKNGLKTNATYTALRLRWQIQRSRPCSACLGSERTQLMR